MSALTHLKITFHFCTENQIFGNNAKGRILKQVFQENKACQIFRKTKISYPLIRTHTTKWNIGLKWVKEEP